MNEITKLCKNCNENFVVQYFQRKQTFCSMKCFGKWRTKSGYGLKQCTGIVKQCLNCEKKFYVKKCLIDISKCCSKKCFIEWRNRTNYGWKKKEGFEKKCQTCKKEYYIPKHRIKNSKFCSNKCIRHNDDSKNKIKNKRLLQIFPIKDSLLEIKFHQELERKNIIFLKHKPINNIKHKYQCDIFIEPNIVIECDGDYWHKYPIGREIDSTRTKEMEEKGYVVFRFWEHEIN